jgi:hypothetical protein
LNPNPVPFYTIRNSILIDSLDGAQSWIFKKYSFPTISPTSVLTLIPTAKPTVKPSLVPSVKPTALLTSPPSFSAASKCSARTDPFNPSATYVICDINAQRAWISGTAPSSFHIASICQSLGYRTFGQVGGNCGSVCGFCDGTHSCSSLGRENYDGAGFMGTDANGPFYGNTVTWNCVN